MTVSTAGSLAPEVQKRHRHMAKAYPGWFYIPAAIIYGVLFLFPTLASLFFSLTRWTLADFTFIGFDNFLQFFREPFLVQGLRNTLLYAVVTSGLKVVLGMALAILLTSQIIGRGFLRSVVFFPVLVSTVGVGITFTVMMHPTKGLINTALEVFGIDGPGWLTNPSLALFSVALVDVWKGVGLATDRADDGTDPLHGGIQSRCHVSQIITGSLDHPLAEIAVGDQLKHGLSLANRPRNRLSDHPQHRGQDSDRQQCSQQDHHPGIP